MPVDPAETVYYRRARFSTRLPRDRVYVKAHYWLHERESGVWRIGFTRFATRLLGDLVESAFYPQCGDPVEIGQSIGWIEGFKAVSDIFCAATGRFVRCNAALEREPVLFDNDPYDRGWLYEVRGTPQTDHLEVAGYMNLLDTTIDRMLKQDEEDAAACPVPGTS